MGPPVIKKGRRRVPPQVKRELELGPEPEPEPETKAEESAEGSGIVEAKTSGKSYIEALVQGKEKEKANMEVEACEFKGKGKGKGKLSDVEFDYCRDLPEEEVDDCLLDAVQQVALEISLKAQRKPMDVHVFCDNLILGYLRSQQGLDYKFVGCASYLIPTFSSTYGDGLHLNFFARLESDPYDSPPILIFAEVANGNPQKVIRCVPLVERSCKLGDEDKCTTPIVHHPGSEKCPYCENAKDGFLGENNYFLAPML